MSGPPDPEGQFIAAIDARAWRGSDAGDTLRALDAWQARVADSLVPGPLRWPGFEDGHALAATAQALHDQWPHDVQAWRDQRRALDATQAVADALAHSAIFLVFGKFNAGKSSFCNFIAERFAARGQPVEYFAVQHGALAAMPPGGRFKEGATETTTALQGVRLGRHLVLLDTPGLHSATPENAALTRRFTDSADGVLWLTSSSSPGQVQELGELARELHRRKPLLPVLTRSDVVEEDEVDGEIVRQLRNKTAQNRALQEADVQQRGREQLALLGVDPALLLPPVSVSSHVARRAGQTAAALHDAGFDRLWAALQGLVHPALAYKQRKAAEIVLHHAEECVLHGLDTGVSAPLASLLHALAEEREALPQRQAALVTTVWRAVAPALPALLERHAAADDVAAVRAAAAGLLADAFATAAHQAWAGYTAASIAATGPLELDEDAGYDRVDDPAHGATAVVIGHERLHAALEHALGGALADAAAGATRQCLMTLDALEASVRTLQDSVTAHRRALADLKAALRGTTGGPAQPDPRWSFGAFG